MYCINTDKCIFADYHSKLHCYYLQAQVNQLTAWCTATGLQQNVKKCRIMSYTRTQNSDLFDYIISDT